MKKSIYKTPVGKNEILKQYEQYVEQLHTNVQRDYIDTRFGLTHVLKMGNEHGQPLFILQGGNCINPMTLSWFKRLFNQYSIYAPDTIGHPGYSEENRISASDNSFALWVHDILDHYNIEKCAFIGPSYGGGIILRLATFHPERIACSVLVSPAGICLGSKRKMIKKVLIPLILYKMTGSFKNLSSIANVMSNNSMKAFDKEIIGNIFNWVSLEQDMPKLTTKTELNNYQSPTLVITGDHDVFFPAHKLEKKSKEILGEVLEYSSYDMGHFPSEQHKQMINDRIIQFLNKHYLETK